MITDSMVFFFYAFPYLVNYDIFVCHSITLHLRGELIYKTILGCSLVARLTAEYHIVSTPLVTTVATLPLEKVGWWQYIGWGDSWIAF